ncbi:MAG: sugar-binding domain-containing protein [Prolixibacteraceae bacterium]
MSRKLILTLLLFFLGLFTTKADVRNIRTKYNFNSDWKVVVGDPQGAETIGFDDTTWKTITLPYAWNQEEAFAKDIAELSTGIAWYRKSFVLPKGSEASKVFIEFEGVRQAGEFYLNGNLAGIHENGVMAVGFDLTAMLKPFPETNVIAVRTNNDWDYRERFYNQKYQWADRNFNANYGGIPKNVYLHITGKVYQTLPLYSNMGTSGVYVYASDFNIPDKKATIHVASQLKNETDEALVAQLRIVIEELNGQTVATFEGTPGILTPFGIKELEASEELSNLEFWSWGYGYLYKVKSQVIVDGVLVDEVPIVTGFRKTEYKNGMVYLNDRVLMMHGYAQRTSNEWPAVGLSVPPWLSDYSNKLMTESNGNFVRWMHVTPWKQDVESCDRVGLIQVMPAGDSEKDVQGRRWEQRTTLMRDAIIYNRNNPSILFYEGGNENISEAHMAELKTIRNTYDSFGGRAVGSREMLDSKEAEYGGEMLYINKSADQPLFATEYSRDEGLRKYWDEYTYPFHKEGAGPLYKGKDASEYNHNQDAHAIENIVRWYDYYHERPGTGKRVSSGGANIIFSDTNTHHRGEENYRRSGETDPMRIPKDNFWAHWVMWAGWVEPETILTHIIGHWNYEKETTKNVYVVSSANQLELLLNGKSLGFGEQSYRFLYTFKNVTFKPGELKAIGYNHSDEKITEAVINTAGKPYALRLSRIESPVHFKADGADMALFEIEVVDKKGQRCPTAFQSVNFSLEGPARWIGGIAQGENNCILSKDLPVECGVNRILIGSTLQAGKVNINAESPGLKSASIEIKSLPVESINGLSMQLASNGLPVNLSKGPTPSTPSYTPSRKAILPIRVQAGANSEQAANSFDDNEMTLWDNDGDLAKGWIKYKLERTANISEVSLKLSGWRTRSYPINILVNDQVVFSGETPRSLGYITCEFEPVMGDIVSIQLIGASSYDDQFDLLEITGQKDQETVKDFEETTSGSLKIVEVEFYEK